MAYGICDVPKCSRDTFMGWRPKTEKTGRQICESHWDRHKAGILNLYDVFGFERPPTINKTVKMKDYCTCGRERKPGHKYCSSCIADRKRQQNRESYHRKKNEPEQAEKRNVLICRGENYQNERQPNHRYCSLCAIRQRRKLDRISKRKIRSIKTG